MTLHKITELNTELFSVCPHKPKNFASSSYLKALLNKIMIQIKLVGMSMMFTVPDFICLTQVQRFMSCLHEQNVNF
jgi:hypothetical protein